MAEKSNVVEIQAATRSAKTRSVSQATTASARKNVSTQATGGTGGPSDWPQTVETRLGELRSDVRNLLIGGAVIAIGLVTAGWGTYTAAMGELRGVAVTQQEIAGKIETLDARMAGRLELMEERLGDKSQAGAPTRQDQGVRGRTPQ